MTSSQHHDPLALLDDLDFVRRLARRLCADRDDAEDLAQEVLVRAVERPPVGGSDLARRGWLSTVTRRLAANHGRGERRRRRRETELARRRGLEATTVPAAAEVVEREQLRARAVEAVLQLDEPYRSALLLRYERGLDTRASAAVLGVAEATVRSRLKRGLDRVRVTLDARHGGDRRAWTALLGPWALSGGEPSAAAAGGAAASGASPAAATGTVAGGPPNLMALAATASAALLLVGAAWYVVADGGDAGPMRTAAAPLDGAGEPSVAPPLVARPADVAPEPRREVPPTGVGRAATGGSLAGQLVGAVIDSDSGGPIAAAEVLVFATVEEDADTEPTPVLEGRTDTAGRYAFPLESLRTRSRLSNALTFLTVVAQAPGYDHDLQQSAALREVLDQAEAGDVRLPALTLVACPNFHGRVLDRLGRPVVGAEVTSFLPGGETLSSASTRHGGHFTLEAPGPEEVDRPLHLLARHPALGLSRPLPLPARAPGPVGDVVLDRQLGVVEGRLSFADGSPAACVEIGVESLIEADAEGEAEPLRLDGVALAHDLDVGLFGRDFLDDRSVRTDDDGRFTLRCLRSGRNDLLVRGHWCLAEEDPADRVRFVIEPGRTTRLECRLTGAQLRVRILDTEDRPLPRAKWALYRWPEAQATDAAARFAREGASQALLASAPVREVLYDATEEVVPAEPGTFVVVEAGWDAAPLTYGSCRFAPGQHRGDVTLRLVERERLDPATTGTLHVGFDGAEPPPSRTWLKLGRGFHQAVSMPIALPGLEAAMAPPSRIFDCWYRLPPSGRIERLPPGDYVLELLPQVEVSTGGRLTGLPSPMQEHAVHIDAGRVTRLPLRTERGWPVRIEFRAPSLASGETVQVDATVRLRVDDPAGHLDRLQLRDDDGSHRVSLLGGSAVVSSLRTLAAGRYRVVVEAGCQVARRTRDAATGAESATTRFLDMQRFACEVSVGLDVAPAVLVLTAN